MSFSDNDLACIDKVLATKLVKAFTPREWQFFISYLARINPKDPNTQKVRYPMQSFLDFVEVKRYDERTILRHLSNLALKGVIEKKSSTRTDVYPLFKVAFIERDTDTEQYYVQFEPNDVALPYLFNLKNFFKIGLGSMWRLSSQLQITFYLFLKNRSIGKGGVLIDSFTIPVSKLKEELGVKDKYDGRTGWSDFRKYVLETCKTAFEKNTDIAFDYECEKYGQGGKWLVIRFKLRQNTPKNQQITFEEMKYDNGEVTADVTIEKCREFEENLAELSADAEPTAEQDLIGFLLDAVDNEFSREEVTVLKDLVVAKGVYDQLEVYNELSRCHNILKARESKGTVNNRFKYLQAVIKKAE